MNNWSNHSSNCNRDNKDTNSANAADIEAWAAIEEIEGDKPDVTTAYTSAQAYLPEVETKLYDSSALRHMSPFHHRFKNY